jgi:hypothetical protein
MTFKLFGSSSNLHIQFKPGSLMRGGLLNRMQGYSTAIRNGIRALNEVRDLEESKPRQNGVDLIIQVATVPWSPIRG